MSDGFRTTCYACYRPESHCVCDFIEPFKAHCNILILQHPNERRKYYSTAKLVLRGISNSKLLRGVVFEPGVLERACEEQDTYVLFPGEASQDCEAVPLSERSTVVVLDGTWSEAGKILRRNPLLSTLPRLSFRRELRSEYKIRKQPKDFCLSTIECIGHLLKLNHIAMNHSNPEYPYDSLFSAFSKMVDQQLRYFPRTRPDGFVPKALY